MRCFKLDISDATLEKDEARHQLRLWGAMTSRWEDNCAWCSKHVEPTEETPTCMCGENYICSQACEALYSGREAARHICDAFKKCPVDPASNARPSPDHRRAILYKHKARGGTFIWVKVQGDTLIIDHPVFDEFYSGDYFGASREWFDFAVVNPAANAEVFRNLGHGIAVGFCSGMMRPESHLDPNLVNCAIRDLSSPGRGCQWPGPLIFFSYGYDLDTYVKVHPDRTGPVTSGAEATMSKEQIWNELDELRWAFKSSDTYDHPEKSQRSKGKEGPLVWKWKVKESGTSMKILDFSRRDYSMTMHYLMETPFNPCPHIRTQITGADVCKVAYLDHPGYKLLKIDITSPRTEPGIISKIRRRPGPPPDGPQPLRDIIFQPLKTPVLPDPEVPMAGAFAVGLRWYIHYLTEINPPFRLNFPLIEHRRTISLMWGLEPATRGRPWPAKLVPPHRACDGMLISHADCTYLSPHHIFALLKYLDFTDPLDWCREGEKGFEAYWNIYARTTPRQAGAHLGGLDLSPYETEDMFNTVIRESATRSAPSLGGTEITLAMMTLPDFGGEARREVLRDIKAFRAMKKGFLVVDKYKY